MVHFTQKQIAIIEEASDWVCRLDQGQFTDQEKTLLADWLRTSPEHIREFLLATATFHELGHIKDLNTLPLEEILRNGSSEIITLLRSEQKPINSSLGTQKTRYFAGAMAAAVACLAVLTVFFINPTSNNKDNQDTITLATHKGEQRSIPLPDGSVIHLNTQSNVIIKYTDTDRMIELSSGEAMFKVAHDPSRPFRVMTGDTITEAIGTTFNVYHQHNRINVAVIEGKVAVKSVQNDVFNLKQQNEDTPLPSSEEAPVKPSQIILTAGEKTTINKVNITYKNAEIKQVPLEAISSWRDRRIIFEDQPLQLVAQEFNRYNTTQIIINDPQIMNIKLNGVFDADNPEAFIKFLEISGIVKADRNNKDKFVLSALE